MLNMIVHRDYRASADSTIKIYQDRIEFYNPGILPPELHMKDILSGNSPSFPRNKQIASIFKEAGIIEKYGSGIQRVHQVIHAAGAEKPLFEIVGGFFKVTLFPISGGVSGGVGGGVGGGVSELLKHIRLHPGEKTTQIKKSLGLPQRTLERQLRELRETAKIEFRGSPRTGGYFPVT